MNARKTPVRPSRRWWRRAPRGDLEATFLEHLPLVERVATAAGRRAGLPPEEVEDFVSQVTVKLIDDDYAVLRKHRGDSRLTTYLTAVVHNQLKDYCNHKWGKFRPSAAAKRLGPEALALERLLVLDRHDPETAVEVLKSDRRVETSREELQGLAARLPVRIPRRFVGEEALDRQATEGPEGDPESRLADGERRATAARVEEVLGLALATLSSEDLLILKMFFRDGLTLAAIASALHLEQRPLYGRKDRCLAQLKAAFDAEGLTWERVREILGWQGREVRADFSPAGEENGEKKGERSV